MCSLGVAYRGYSSTQDAEVSEDSPHGGLTACCIVKIKVGSACQYVLAMMAHSPHRHWGGVGANAEVPKDSPDEDL